MKRAALFLVALALVTVACTPPAPPPAVPGAGCYVALFGSGSIYYTGVEPTPWEPHNFYVYNPDPDFDCSPPEVLSGELSGVNAANQLDAWAKCNELVGPTLYPPQVTAAVYFHTSPDFANIWMCFPTFG